ncbi:MAG: alpha/beta fold hydrolase, partial [Caldimonas sp.]
TRFESAGVPDVGAALAAAMQGKPIAAPYLLSDMADDAIGLLDAFGIETAHVVGASMGGAIGQTLAINHPSRLRTLTSIMATTGAPGL